jgi:hypothetical protein
MWRNDDGSGTASMAKQEEEAGEGFGRALHAARVFPKLGAVAAFPLPPATVLGPIVEVVRAPLRGRPAQGQSSLNEPGQGTASTGWAQGNGGG